MLDLRIELAADENNHNREPQPSHEADDRADRAVGFVEIAKVRSVPGEKGGSSNPSGRRERAAWGDPLPPRLCPAWAVSVNQSKGERDEHQQDRPRSNFQDQTRACRQLL